MFGIVPSCSKQPLLDNFMYEESIPSRRPASSPRRFDLHHLKDTRNLLTSHRFVERRWTGAMCLSRVARRASFSQAESPLDSAASNSYTLGVSLNRRSINSCAERPSTDTMVRVITKISSVRPTEPHLTTASENYISYAC